VCSGSFRRKRWGEARFLFFASEKLNMPNKHRNFIKRTFVLLPLFTVSIFSFALVYSVFAGDITPSKVIELTNRARTANSMGTLSENAKLSQAANAKARDMIKNDYFAHISPSGRDPWYWMKKEGYEYKAAGENLAINFTSAKEEQSAWMDSQTHRANILNAQYQEIGVAVVEGKIDGQNSIVTVQMFGSPLYAAVDQAKAVAPPIVAEEKAPEIKGIETSETETSLPITPAPQFIQNLPKFTAPVAEGSEFIQTERLFDATWAIAVFLLFFSLISPPLAFFCKAWQLVLN
jgi:hypothetical protein